MKKEHSFHTGKFYRFNQKNGLYTGIWISKADIEILKLFLELKIVPKNDLLHYGATIYGMREDNVSIRLRKWVKEDILNIRRYGTGHYYYYRLGKRGFEILKDKRIIKDFPKQGVRFPSSNHVHQIGLRSSLLKISVEFIKAKKLDFTFYSDMKLYKSEFRLEQSKFTPDGIFKMGSRLIHIEIDTSLDNFKRIKSKINYYTNLAKANPLEKFEVLIVVIDDVNDRPYLEVDKIKKKRERVVNLQNELIRLKVHSFSNLKFFVVLNSKLPLFAEKLTKGISFENTRIKEMAIYSLEYGLEQDGYTVQRVLASEDIALSESTIPSIFADGHYLIKFDGNGQSKFMLVILMQMGCTSSMNTIHYLDKMKEVGGFKIQVDYIVAIYYNKNEMLEDYHEYYQNIVFTSFDALRWSSLFRAGVLKNK